MAKKPAAPKAKKITAPVPQVPAADRALLYVKAGQTVGWRELFVWDVRAKAYVRDILEANAAEGWYDQAIRKADGTLEVRPMGVAYRRVRRRIEIHRRTPKKKP